MSPASSGLFWIASYPKSGNTWVRCLLSSLLQGGAAPKMDALCDIASAKGLIDCALGLSSEDLTDDEITALRPETYRHLAVMGEPPRCFKVHDRFDATLFPPDITAGSVYIVRDPRDIVSSFADHTGRSLDQTIDRMGRPGFVASGRRNGHQDQAEQIYDTWSANVLSWLDGAAARPLLLLRYEDMLTDPIGQATRLACFLGLPDDADIIGRSVAACRFDTLRQTEEAHGFTERMSTMQRFFRRGQAKAWMRDLTPAQVTRIENDHQTVMTRLGYLP